MKTLWQRTGAVLCCCAGLLGNSQAAEYRPLPGGEFRSVLPADGISAPAHIQPYWLRTQPVDRLWLTTDAHSRACGFYERRGWQRVGMVDRGEVRFERENRSEQ